MRAKIVVGLGFGDEGKGMTTDYLCDNNHSPVVVRYNGGHQAGHTVVRDNVKHVHSSFGAGSLQGIPTYISDYCCFYPPSMYEEEKILKAKGITPIIHIHPLAKLTTPYDVAFNRLRETCLGHGSVGVGIGTTFTRNSGTYKLHAADLEVPAMLEEKMQQIKGYYNDKLSGYTPKDVMYYKSEVEKQSKLFYAALSSMKLKISSYEYLQQFSTIVFEGAQGILLDMDCGIFPNVTYSHCTSKNALSICRALNISDIAIHYVTRCYQTRHGNGWMSNEGNITLINNEEEINVMNDWQRNFRVGELDVKLLNYALKCDDAYSFGYEKHLTVTCLDQRPDYKFPYDKLCFKFESHIQSSSHHAERMTEDFLFENA